MKRIRIADTIAQGDAVFLGLLPFRIALGVGPPHLGDQLLIAGRGRGSVLGVGYLGEQAALDDRHDFFALDRLPSLVFAGGQVIDCLQQARVFERFTLAGLKGEHQGSIGGISDRHGQPL